MSWVILVACLKYTSLVSDPTSHLSDHLFALVVFVLIIPYKKKLLQVS